MLVPLAARLDLVEASLVGSHEFGHALLQRLEALGDLTLQHLLHDVEVGAIGDVADGSHYLQLGRTLIDREDTRVAEEALRLILHDEARTTVDGDGVVSILVGPLGVGALGQRRESISQSVPLLQFLTLLGRQFAVAADILQCLVEIDVACRLIEQGATRVELGLHAREHVIDGGEADDLLAKLHALLGVGETLVVSLLLHADALCCNAQARTIHQGHHILDETHACAATELCLGVLEDQLAGGRTVDTEFVLDVAHRDAAALLVVDEHREATSVVCALLRAGKHQVDIRVAIGDESLHTVQTPRAVLVLCGLEHDALQIAASVGPVRSMDIEAPSQTRGMYFCRCSSDPNS